MRFKRVCSAVIGAVLLLSGLLHEMNPLFFVQTVLAYNRLPFWGATLVGMLLPPLQVFVGIALMFGPLTGGAYLLGAGLFFTFGVAGLSAKISGQFLSCGCFGSVSMPVTWAHVIVVFTLAAYCGMEVCMHRARFNRTGRNIATDGR